MESKNSNDSFKSNIVNAIASETGSTVATVKKIVDSFINVTKTEVLGGSKVSYQGFGTFQLATSKARKGVNPHTREVILIPEKEKVKFVISKQWQQEAANKK